MDVSELNVRW
jgi:prevent-host-death family protein